MQGSCLCGAVGYEVDEIISIKFCHCRTCQLAQGAPYIAAGGVKREHFRWLKGEELVTRYESSPGKQRCFCSRCGTPLLADRANLPHIALRVVTLKEDPKLRPTEHIWLNDDCPWTLDTPNLPRYPAWPTV